MLRGGRPPGGCGPVYLLSSSGSRPSASTRASTPNTADRASSEPVTIVSSFFSSLTPRGESDGAVAPFGSVHSSPRQSPCKRLRSATCALLYPCSGNMGARRSVMSASAPLMIRLMSCPTVGMSVDQSLRESGRPDPPLGIALLEYEASTRAGDVFADVLELAALVKDLHDLVGHAVLGDARGVAQWTEDEVCSSARRWRRSVP